MDNYRVYARKGHGHSILLGSIDSDDIQKAFETMKEKYKTEWVDTVRYTECYVYRHLSYNPGHYEIMGRSRLRNI